MSQCVYNKINTTWKVLCMAYTPRLIYLFVYLFILSEISLVRFAHCRLTRSISCKPTTRA